MNKGELASPLVADVLGVSSLTHSFGGAVPAAFVAEASKRLSGLWQEHGLRQPPFTGCYQAPHLDICPPSVQTVLLLHIPVVQPLRPISWSGPAATFEPTDDPRPLVYVTLGTVASNPAVLRDALAGVASLDVQVLVTVGPMGDRDALGPQPAHVRVERFVPQTQVLPYAAVVVSHGGSGTFLGALSHGLPQICLPQAADQFRNAAGVLQSGAGARPTASQGVLRGNHPRGPQSTQRARFPGRGRLSRRRDRSDALPSGGCGQLPLIVLRTDGPPRASPTSCRARRECPLGLAHHISAANP